VLCVGAGQGKLRSVGSKTQQSTGDARGCVELAQEIHSSIVGSGSGSQSGSRAGDVGGTEAAREEERECGWRDGEGNRVQSLLDQLLLRLERGLSAREEREEDKDAMDLVGIKIAECVVVALGEGTHIYTHTHTHVSFGEGSHGWVTGGVTCAGSLTWSSKSVLVRVASRLLLRAGVEGTRGRGVLLLSAADPKP
jgi:hypothetical protein